MKFVRALALFMEKGPHNEKEKYLTRVAPGQYIEQLVLSSSSTTRPPHAFSVIINVSHSVICDKDKDDKP